jgi:hypothetical protein
MRFAYCLESPFWSVAVIIVEKQVTGGFRPLAAIQNRQVSSLLIDETIFIIINVTATMTTVETSPTHHGMNGRTTNLWKTTATITPIRRPEIRFDFVMQSAK